MSYQTERDQFIASMEREGLPLRVTQALLRAATTLQRYAELACSSEAADRDRVPCPAATTRTVRIAGQSREMPRKPSGPCICEDYPAGTHAAGQHTKVTRIDLLGDRLERRIAAMLAGVFTCQACHRAQPEVNAKRIAASPVGLALGLAACTYCGGVCGGWIMHTQGDPRGYVLRVIPPSYTKRNAGRDRFNLDSIGVPARESRLRF